MDYLKEQKEYEKKFYKQSKKQKFKFYNSNHSDCLKVSNIIAFQQVLNQNINQKIYLRLNKLAEMGSYQMLYGEFEITGIILNFSPKHLALNVKNELRVVRFRDIIEYKFLN